MVDLSDEMLMAYADGSLDPVSRDVVEAAIRHRPEYRKKVEIFRQTSTPVRQAFGNAPASDRLAALIKRIRRVDPGAMDVAAGRATPTRRADAAVRARARFPARHWPAAVAASIALLIGVGLGWTLHSSAVPVPWAQGMIAFRDRGLAAQGPLQDLLEAAKSGTTIVADGGGRAWRLKASFTFESHAGAFCRRYEMANDGGAHFSGYACRSERGPWLIQAHVRSRAPIYGKSGFVPSAGESDAGLDAAIDAVRNGDVLEPTLENGLLENGWQNSRR